MDADESERGMRNNDNVPVARGNLSEQPAPLPLLQVFLAGGEHLRPRVEAVDIRGELLNKVVGHHDHGLPGQSHPPALHCPGDAGEGLARSDRVVVEHKSVDYTSPDGIQLVAPHFDKRVGNFSGQLEVLAVALFQHADIVFLVEQVDQCAPPLAVPEHPAGELLLNLGDLHGRSFGGFLVENGRLVYPVVIGNPDGLAVQHGADETADVARFRSPLFCLFGDGIRLDKKGVGRLLEANPSRRAREEGDEIGVDRLRNPRRPREDRHLVGTPRLRLYFLQGIDVLLHPCRFCRVELSDDVAAEVLVSLFPGLCLGIEEDQRFVEVVVQVGDNLLFALAKQGRDHAKVDPASLGEIQGQGIIHILRLGRC